MSSNLSAEEKSYKSKMGASSRSLGKKVSPPMKELLEGWTTKCFVKKDEIADLIIKPSEHGFGEGVELFTPELMHNPIFETKAWKEMPKIHERRKDFVERATYYQKHGGEESKVPRGWSLIQHGHLIDGTELYSVKLKHRDLNITYNEWLLIPTRALAIRHAWDMEEDYLQDDYMDIFDLDIEFEELSTQKFMQVMFYLYSCSIGVRPPGPLDIALERLWALDNGRDAS